MLTKRIIACLDMRGGRIVKGVQFTSLRDAGDPAELAQCYSQSGADEIVLLDIAAAHPARSPLLEVVRRTARQVFVPLAVGGGVRSLADACALFEAGADKVTINTAAFEKPEIIGRIASRFGSQAVVIAVDAKRGEAGQEVWLSGGRKPTGRSVLSWCKEAEERGAGEILLTSIDRDGTAAGFDCQLVREIARAIRIPVIASGGAGSIGHFSEVFRCGEADAALAASIFHFGVHSICDLKAQLSLEGIPVRWPC